MHKAIRNLIGYLFGIILVLGLLGALINLSVVAAETTDSSWVNNTAGAVVSPGDVLPGSEFANYGQAMINDCDQRTYTSEFTYTIEGCWVDANGLKLVYGGWQIKFDDEPHAAYIRLDPDEKLHVSRNKNILIHTKRVSDDAYQLSFVRAEDVSFIKHYDENHTFVEYELVFDQSHTIRANADTPYLIDGSTLYAWSRYSENKEWLALWNHDGFFVLLNLNDFTVRAVRLTNSAPSNYASLGVSDNGRYVAAVLYGENEKPTVFDMNTCSRAAGEFVSEPASCKSENLGTALEASDAYGTSGIALFPVYFAFHNNEVLSFYSPAPDGASGYREHIVRAPALAERTNYVAVGDSFASGEGAGSYFKATDVPNGNNCHLSRSSYPFLLRYGLGLRSIKSVACSGARIQNISGPEYIDDQIEDESRTNQYKFSRDMHSELDPVPGYYLQHIQYSSVTDIVTVSIGGNDIGFKEIVTSCAKPKTCYTSESKRRSLIKLIDAQLDRLVATYDRARQSVKGARVYAIGYPRLVKPDGSCGNNVRMNAAELEFANNLTNYLNDIIRIASARAGVVYVDTSEAFYGHRLCEPSPVVHGVNTAWGWLPFSPESYHPTSQGQLLLAQAINRATRGFSAPMPRPDAYASIPTNLAITRGLLTPEEEAPTSSGVIDFAYPPYQTYASAGGVYSGSISSGTYGLLPNAQHRLSMASTPTFLGYVMSDGNGVVHYSFTVPQNTPPGLHTLYVEGTAANGEAITVEQQMYVIASEDDWDGDGVKNEDSPCWISLPVDEQGGRDFFWCGNPRAPKVDFFAPQPAGEPGDRVFTDGGNPILMEREENIFFNMGETEKRSQANGGNRVDQSSEYILIGAIIVSALLVIYAYGWSKKHR